MFSRKTFSSPLALLALAGMAAGCVAHERPLLAFPAPTPTDGGIEIARTALLKPSNGTANGLGAPLDCGGIGVGIQVDSAQGSPQTLFGQNGEPCEAADILFNGASAAGQRQADPGITIRMHDALGTLLDERTDLPEGAARARTRFGAAGNLDAIPTIRVSEDLVQAAAAPSVDPLMSTLRQWQRADSAVTQRSAETDEASTRELTRLVSAAESQSSGQAAATLAAQLRERERVLQEERRRLNETLAASAQNRATTQAARDAWQQEQNRLQSELNAAKTRAAQFEQLAARLAEDKKRQESAMGERISTLSGHLRLAEAQADTSRRQLILQAAAKVAEAQALATAAKVDAQSDQLAEASRLQAQANELMDKVLMARNEGTIEPNAGPADKTPALPLAEAPVVLEAKGRTLPEILAEVLQQAAPHSGAWRAEWQLSGKAQALLTEKWSLTAEASVGQILKNLQQQVSQAHGLTLNFTPFPQRQVLVVTDTP